MTRSKNEPRKRIVVKYLSTLYLIKPIGFLPLKTKLDGLVILNLLKSKKVALVARRDEPFYKDRGKWFIFPDFRYAPIKELGGNLNTSDAIEIRPKEFEKYLDYAKNTELNPEIVKALKEETPRRKGPSDKVEDAKKQADPEDDDLEEEEEEEEDDEDDEDEEEEEDDEDEEEEEDDEDEEEEEDDEDYAEVDKSLPCISDFKLNPKYLCVDCGSSVQTATKNNLTYYLCNDDDNDEDCCGNCSSAVIKNGFKSGELPKWVAEKTKPKTQSKTVSAENPKPKKKYVKIDNTTWSEFLERNCKDPNITAEEFRGMYKCYLWKCSTYGPEK